MSYRLYEDPTRISGVRAYERGDPLNRVHWRATARTGVLHSKVYEPSTVIGATLLLEFHTAAHEKKHEPHRSELAVTAAASIANAVYLLNQQIGLVTNGRDAADRVRHEGWAHDHRSRVEALASASVRECHGRTSRCSSAGDRDLTSPQRERGKTSCGDTVRRPAPGRRATSPPGRGFLEH